MGGATSTDQSESFLLTLNVSPQDRFVKYDRAAFLRRRKGEKYLVAAVVNLCWYCAALLALGLREQRRSGL